MAAAQPHCSVRFAAAAAQPLRKSNTLHQHTGAKLHNSTAPRSKIDLQLANSNYLTAENSFLKSYTYVGATGVTIHPTITCVGVTHWPIIRVNNCEIS